MIDLELVTDETSDRWLRETRYPATSLSSGEAHARIMLLIRERVLLKRKLMEAGGSHLTDKLVERLL